MSYVNPFGGEPQNPSQISLNTLALTGDVQLFWPWSGQATTYVLAKILRVSADAAGYDVLLPTATQASNGEASIFINTGANSFNVDDATGANITSVTSGQSKFVYLISNATEGGIWGVFTFGTGSSGADASALAGAGLLAIANTLNEQITTNDFSVTPSTLNSAARANLYNWTGGAGVLNIADPATLGTGWFTMVRNTGSGALVVTPAAGMIDGGSTKTFNPGDAAFIVRDGGNLLTIGFGQSAAFSFDYISINVAGAGNFTLNSSQQNRISYRFTGLLTGTRTIIVPATVQQYWVDNSTTGAFSLYVKTAAQGAPGVILAQGARDIFYCDGSSVVDAVTGGVSVPIAIADGGTGATTASGARSNLGATTVGDALFTAASAAAARATLALGNLAVLNTVGTAQIDNDAVTTAKILDANVTTAKLINNAVTFAKMQAITDGRLLGASGATVVEEITVGSGLTLTSNTLSATEEGTFTPALAFGGGSVGITYSFRSGNYTRIGNIVRVQGRVTLSSKGSSTGTAVLTGLPFTVINSVPISMFWTAMVGLTGVGSCLCSSGTSTIPLFQSVSTGWTTIVDTFFTITSDIYFNGVYQVS